MPRTFFFADEVGPAFDERDGPSPGRSHAGTPTGPKPANMKRLRCRAAGSAWRIAFAFDPDRQAILFGGGDKPGGSEKRVDRLLIARADEPTAIRLMVNPIFVEDDDVLTKPGIVRTIYDSTAGESSIDVEAEEGDIAAASFALRLTTAIARTAARDENSARRAIAQPRPTSINDQRVLVTTAPSARVSGPRFKFRAGRITPQPNNTQPARKSMWFAQKKTRAAARVLMWCSVELVNHSTAISEC